MAEKTCKRCGQPNTTGGDYCCDQCATLAARAQKALARRMDEFYNPDRARRERLQRQRLADALSQVLVQGTSYIDD
ncbi:TPA: hypothetical protein DIU27_04640 [Candidatus Collierbacteria bacterium]|uniref:Uncharacterized protein n=1 Tax=Candidatus Collierbacteria bacterium GW2011_GWB2_44_22 TaxID=1618387 RepID=A0A0G1K607_9BACT|nr:MAG: hypothetical protein UW31_C0011G0008 [Candidatus Collierbacteria bacterium GW2011_GWA2_44_13]KKT51752.1 MAG: hypothetical protein UW44_C0008G0074 [Candidatus Collierbacteria bacterium GW2011_GWB2_44_22]KKT63654.1 MAG: hypothetical protein UW58_C0054G0004 [Candidatus Collierbacteria bacterium GW2011_GWC2_44_30]KKT68288.1 MAG: hypothetical protein UW64_C0023G0004 [Microgenomates group bacterium GW2011_GWC1_44_37]KKT88235.1 MAG: hypothetical protein UW88_C0013G0004 [Candidatus Collierbacte